LAIEFPLGKAIVAPGSAGWLVDAPEVTSAAEGSVLLVDISHRGSKLSSWARKFKRRARRIDWRSMLNPQRLLCGRLTIRPAALPSTTGETLRESTNLSYASPIHSSGGTGKVTTTDSFDENAPQLKNGAPDVSCTNSRKVPASIGLPPVPATTVLEETADKRETL